MRKVLPGLGVLALLFGIGPLIAFLALSVSFPSPSVILVGGLTALAAVSIVMPGLRTKPFYGSAATAQAPRPTDTPQGLSNRDLKRRPRWRTRPPTRRQPTIQSAPATRASWRARRKRRTNRSSAIQMSLPVQPSKVAKPSDGVDELQLLLGEIALILRRDLELIQRYEAKEAKQGIQHS